MGHERGLTDVELALVATGLPYALQVARRIARTTRVLGLDDLEGVARLALNELVSDFDPERGAWKSFVCTRVGFALCRSLRKERRCSSISAEDAIRAGLEHVEGMTPAPDSLSGNDDEAHAQLVEITAEVADVLALHLGAGSTDLDSAVRAAVAALPVVEAQVVTLHYLEGMSFRQIGAEIGCTHMQAYRAHERALPKLRRSLRPLR